MRRQQRRLLFAQLKWGHSWKEEPTWSSGTRRKLAVASSVFFQGQPGSFSSRSCSCTVASRTLSSPRAWYASSGTQRQKLEREATDMSIAPRFALPRRASRRSGCESVCQSNAIAVSYLKYREPIFQPWTLREAWSAQVFYAFDITTRFRQSQAW